MFGKNRILWLVSILIISGILMSLYGFYKIREIYFPSKEEIYESNWNIKIPKIEKMLLNRKDKSFSGDGDEIVIYITEEQIDNNYNSYKEEDVENVVKEILLKFKINEFHPNFNKMYQWKKYVKNQGYDIVYILYFPESREVYIVRQSI